MLDRHRTPLAAYGVALLATAVSLLLRLAIWPFVGGQPTYSSMLLAVVISAYYGGFWPGMLSTFVGALGVDLFITGPQFELMPAAPGEVVGLVLFIVVGTIISGL